VTALVLLLVGLVLNGVVSAATSSTSYVELVNRSFAAQANSVFEAQQVEGNQLSALLRTMPTLDRPTLALRLDTLVAATTPQVDVASMAASPPPSRDVGPGVASVVAERAKGVALIRQAVDGLLGIIPASPQGSTAPTSAPALLSASEAASMLSTAGNDIAAADRAIGPLRARLAASPGHAHLIRSVFVSDATLLSPSTMTGLVGALQSSSSLQVRHQLTLTTFAVVPAPLPTPLAFHMVQLPPTSSLMVTATVQNLGNVTESSVVVIATLTSPLGVPLGTAKATGTVSVGGAVTLDLGSLKVTPGTDVVLTITLLPPAGQSDRTGLVQRMTLVIAPTTVPPARAR